MKILITGASGFIGINLTKAFLKKEYKIFSISRNNTNIFLNNVIFKQCDINNIENLANDILEFDPNVVIHCAWDGGNSYIDINNQKQFNNVLNSYKLLEVISKLKKVHFICMGSATEYGETNIIIDETTIENPNSFYGISKFSFKMLSYNFCKQNKIQWSWIRPFYTYGPHDITTRLIPKTIISCLHGENIELNSCNSVIDYLFIDDFVDGVINIVEKKLEGVYNICSGKQFLIKDIINEIYHLCGNKNKIIFNKNLDRTNFPNFICGSNNKLINKTKNWFPKFNLNDGLIKTINFYEKLSNY